MWKKDSFVFELNEKSLFVGYNITDRYREGGRTVGSGTVSTSIK